MTIYSARWDNESYGKKKLDYLNMGQGLELIFLILELKANLFQEGGQSSGLMSFLKVGDVSAGAIKSGGTTRRAAKMVIVDIDHPDIEDFIHWKTEEEMKVAALVAGSKVLKTSLNAILNSCINCSGSKEECFDVSENASLKREIKKCTN